MKIDSLSLEMSSQHYLEQSHSVQQRVSQWLQPAASAANPSSPDDAVDISASGRLAAAEDSEAGSDTLSPALSLLRNILEKTFGIRISLNDVYPLDREHLEQAAQEQALQSGRPRNEAASQAGGEEGARWAMRIQSEQRYSEQESLQFSASGNITTRDGRELSFRLDVSLARSFEISSSQTLNFGAATEDPLLISLGNDAGTLSGATVRFDLNGDGEQEQLPMLQNGGWLALDRNGNGRIDQQNELFGPQSGDGFGELAQLDSDGNGAIDEGDPLFARLRLWQGQGQTQDQLSSLADVGIGALLLSHVDASFRHTDADNQTLAQMRKAGVYLKEDGQAGLISHIDLSA